MVCPTCHGTGSQYIQKIGDFPAFSTLCPGCQGSGIVSCCDTAGAATPVSAGENWQKFINSQLAGTARKDETALYARIVELEKRVAELERDNA